MLDFKSGNLFDDAADILISCRGGFNRVMWPDIPGLHSFKNKLIHSGQWDERSVSIRNRPVEKEKMTYPGEAMI